MTTPLKVMIVALEPSADSLGAGLMLALRQRLGDGGVEFLGVGGPAMTAEGLSSAFAVGDMAIFGLDQVATLLKAFWRVEVVTRLAVRERPDAVVLIDSWGFTVQVAQRLKKRAPDVTLVKYIAPQVWASRGWRARTLARAADHLLAIHSFEPPYFEKEGLATTFVGNPVLAADLTAADGARLRASIGASPDEPILLILPGSRPGEIAQLIKPFEGAVDLLKAARPDLRLVLPVAAAVAETVKTRVAGWRHRVHVVEGEAARRDAMAAATVALTKSGTVTTELALAGCPMVIAYKFPPVTALIVRMVIRTPYVALLNIAAGKAIAPELLQENCTAAKLAAAVGERLDDPDLRARQVAAQNAALVTMGLGGPDPSLRAAEAVIEAVRAKRAGAKA